jgi:hypothetical protein
MTLDVDYAINDVVCLMRCEDQLGYIDDIIHTLMEADNVGMSIGAKLTGAQINTIDYSRELKSRGLAYKV